MRTVFSSVLLFSFILVACTGSNSSGTPEAGLAPSTTGPNELLDANPSSLQPQNDPQTTVAPAIVPPPSTKPDNLSSKQSDQTPLLEKSKSGTAKSPAPNPQSTSEPAPNKAVAMSVATKTDDAIPTGSKAQAAAVAANLVKEVPNAPSIPENPTVKEIKPEPPFSHDAWDGLLKKHVSQTGKVNYEGFKSDKVTMENYLISLQNNPPKTDWPRNKTMAYWINAYNAFTIKLILDSYPVSSITKLEGGKPWDKKWIKIGEKTYSLNNIENDILRPVYKDARIHFAVNCAAKSCPPLLNQAWTAENLESNFEKQAKAFINNPNFNKLSEKEIQVSKIFEWYAADFGDLITYLNKYSSVKINGNAKVVFMAYDWDLNK